MKLKTFLFSFFRTFCILGVILYLSFASPSTVKSMSVIVVPDKLVHFCMYFGLTLVVSYDFWRYKKSIFLSPGSLFPCLLWPIVIGGVVELAQENFFYPRSAEWLDFVANTLGALVAWLAMSLFIARKSKTM